MFRFFIRNKILVMILTIALAVVVMSIYNSRRSSASIDPLLRPQGQSKEISTLLLETGAKVLQSNAPLNNTNIYFAGFHPMKDDPHHQMEAHHYCKQVNEDFAQCVLYDSNTRHANLTGLEYIISEKLYDQLPQEERQYWHPHNYEILSGQLIAPGLPAIIEKQMLKKKINSYGKTYHTWRTQCWQDDKPFMDTLPKGEAILAWSFNHDNEIRSHIVHIRDANMQVKTHEKRDEREGLMKHAHPQRGVNFLNSKFDDASYPFPGVIDRDDLENKLSNDISAINNYFLSLIKD